MQTISEVMTRDVRSISPRDTLQRAAQMMDELNVGSLPVCDGARLVGMVTDRDITVRATSAAIGPGDATVDDVMSADVQWCFEDQPVDEVMKKMADTQIRRVPVVSHDDQKKLIGIVSLGDVSTRPESDGKQGVGQTMEKVSSPSQPDLSSKRKSASGSPQANARPLGSGDTKIRPATGGAGDTSTGIGTGGPSDASGGVAATAGSGGSDLGSRS